MFLLRAYSAGTAGGLIAGAGCLMLSLACAAHATDVPADAQMRALLESLAPEVRARTVFAFEDAERYRFRWTPGRREGVRLDELNASQSKALADLMRTVLSDTGARKVDAIIATEAALGVIEGSPDYRDPKKYWTTVFGMPGPDAWGMRFEGHHLSVNLTFRGAEIISATPLFLGANPERVSSGPDKGLRALASEVDLAWALYQSLNTEQRKVARGSGEWFGGFLTSAGERRADLGKPSGIRADALSPEQQLLLRRLIAAYVDTIASSYAAPYLQRAFEEEWPALHFHWSGADTPGDSYYYRIAGKRLLIEHDNRSGGTHVHAVWRDAVHDFGGL
ncbi:MAG: DUF3500 domain-containing protein [Gammaproteobacteria bacterium]|nr:DUF3500 domain-containing protein [Gammaproteobacteria bacterium]